MRSIGGPEIIVIAVVFLLLFGGKKLPDLARGLGEGIKNFKKSVKDETPSEDKKT
jgi:sec-independent protein translocase protein TatA